jgi:hypothetical protein
MRGLKCRSMHANIFVSRCLSALSPTSPAYLMVRTKRVCFDARMCFMRSSIAVLTRPVKTWNKNSAPMCAARLWVRR